MSSFFFFFVLQSKYEAWTLGCAGHDLKIDFVVFRHTVSVYHKTACFCVVFFIIVFLRFNHVFVMSKC